MMHRCNTSNCFISPLNCISRKTQRIRKRKSSALANSMRSNRFRWVSDCTNAQISHRILRPYCQDCGIQQQEEAILFKLEYIIEELRRFFCPLRWQQVRNVTGDLHSSFCESSGNFFVTATRCERPYDLLEYHLALAKSGTQSLDLNLNYTESLNIFIAFVARYIPPLMAQTLSAFQLSWKKENGTFSLRR